MKPKIRLITDELGSTVRMLASRTMLAVQKKVAVRLNGHCYFIRELNMGRSSSEASPQYAEAGKNTSQ